LFDLGLFANRSYSSGIGAITALFFAMYGVSFLLSQYIQFVQGANVLGVGLRFVPLAAGSLISSNIAARLTGWFGVRPVLLAGMSLVTVGLAILATVSATSTYLPVGVAFGCIGFGMGLAIAPASNAVVSSLPADKVGAGSGLRSMVQLLGGSFGVAIVGSLATSRYRSQVHAAFAGSLHSVPPGRRASIGDQIGQASITSHQLSAGLGDAVQTVADHAFVSGMRLSAVIGGVVTLLATVAVAIYIPRDAGTQHPGEDDADRSEREAHAAAVA
jgi:Na+/melibiose symporter-like transporter